jgi:hypothetical protein
MKINITIEATDFDSSKIESLSVNGINVEKAKVLEVISTTRGTTGSNEVTEVLTASNCQQNNACGTANCCRQENTVRQTVQDTTFDTDLSKIIEFLEEDDTDYTFRSTKAISEGTGLSEDRVRHICSNSSTVRRNSGTKETWTVR